MEIITLIIVIAIGYFIFSLPLYLGLKIMGSPQGIIKVGIVNFFAILINLVVLFFFSNGLLMMIVPFLVTALFYKIMFKMSFFKSVFVLILQYVLSIAVYFAAMTLGVSFLIL